MKMEPVAADVGFEFVCETILVRADQLQKLESDSLVDRKTLIYNLQRKVIIITIVAERKLPALQLDKKYNSLM